MDLVADESSDGDSITIVIPTLNRPHPLNRAVASADAAAARVNVAVDIVIVDNSADASARDQVQTLAATSSAPVRYVSETAPGVATARNRGVAEATGAWVAFLDDDETASPEWLAAMLATARRVDADAVFGPVDARGEEAAFAGALGVYFTRAFHLPDGADLTVQAAYLGTNNSMFDRRRCLSNAKPFDESLNRCGGEDSLLIRRLQVAGRRLAWCPEGRVTEWVPPRRLTWSYVRRRKFLSGQVRTFVHRMLEPPNWRMVIFWMCVGAAQAAIMGAAALALAPFDRMRARHMAASALGGLGKVLWQRRFRPGLYGAGLVS